MPRYHRPETLALDVAGAAVALVAAILFMGEDAPGLVSWGLGALGLYFAGHAVREASKPLASR